MPLNDDESNLFKKLQSLHSRAQREIGYYNDVYEGQEKLKQLGLSIPPELEHFAVWLAWPATAVDSIEERLNVTGFRMPGMTADESLWGVWTYNNMDERQSFAHIDALALGRSYLCVGTNEEDSDYPLITVESPQEMTAIRDPRTHHVTGAVRQYVGDDGARRATLYLPNVTYWLRLDKSKWVDEYDPDVHNLGTVPVVPMVNRSRATRRRRAVLEGVSEMARVIPVAESASRAVTNLQLAQESIAAPTRGVLGATKSDFIDEAGNVLPAWETYYGGVWALANKEAKTFQFDAADLGNWDKAVTMYARQASGLTGLPIDHFGVNTNNPPSAEGQRAGDTRLIKRTERKQTPFGHSYESMQRLVMRFRDGEWDPDARRMETIWQDAGTPTIGMVTDAIVKRYQAGLTDWETAQERLGETPEAIRKMKQRRDADANLGVNFGDTAASGSFAAEE
ncbi:phage portal protein [Rathayibacter sp. VKM Ac-2630]|uniref:phage portal protein n=1 Tax=Rathayibacter sp. VKM Ac-2630 TaxID=1938617 RepID=UPI0009813ED7|nr:phage portal protein [Rathayibacter sp. VKM Ac-2630]OOB91197.1 hypothetical protein B0T42_07300 [Rathayibacter sp. VKM Ac-2630]